MKTIIRLFALLTFIYTINIAQTISSKTTGGHWNDVNTWVGGVIPGETNDVIINGPIIIGTTVCNNLTINSGGSIADECCAGRSITIKGNLINYGTVMNTPGQGGVQVNVEGNVTNNGLLLQNGLQFSGNHTQYIGGTQKFSCGWIWKAPDGQIIANSDIVIDSTCSMDLAYDTLNMGSFKLTKLRNVTSASEIRYGVIYSNGQIDISGNSVLHSDLDGEFTLVNQQPLQFGSITIHGNLHIGPGSVITDEPSSGRSIWIKGNLFNEGTIKNSFGGLDINVMGNVVNNGVMIQYNLRFGGNTAQYISGTQKFSPSWIWKEPHGQIIAASDLLIDSTTSFNLWLDTLNMGNYKLTKFENLVSPSEFRYGVIYSDGLLDISGHSVIHCDLDGNFTLVNQKPLEFGSLNVLKNMHIGSGAIITDECCSGRLISVKGDLINDGTIKNSYGGLTMRVEGNVINNSVMSQLNLHFFGSGNQYIGGLSPYSCSSVWKDPNGSIIAMNDIIIDSTCNFYMDYDTLDMGSFKLTKLNNVNSSTYISGGFVKSFGEIDFNGRFLSNLKGAPILTGTTRTEFGTVYVLGDLYVAKDKVISDECCAGRDLTVYGHLFNSGIIKNQYGGLKLIVEGDIYNYNEISCYRIIQRSGGKDVKISGNFANEIIIEQSGDPLAGKSEADGYFKTSKYFYVNPIATFNIPEGSVMENYGRIESGGALTNSGTFFSKYHARYNGDQSLLPASAISLKLIDKKNVDTVSIRTTQNSVHPEMVSSTKQWWRITGNGQVGSYTTTLYYDDNSLNGNDENTLEAYLSLDEGRTWKKISNPLNITRDVVNNTVTVGNDSYPITEGFGDIILSSGNIVYVPSISVAVGGRYQIRVGPPNRYTVSYWNNSNLPTDYFVLQLNTNRGVHIKSVFTKEIATGNIIEIPVDSLTYDGYKDEVILIAQPLQPKEVRSFDVILTAEPGYQLGKTNELITFTAAALWLGGAILTDWVTNTMVEGCYEMWRPVSNNESLADATVKVVGNSIKKSTTVENGIKSVGKKAGAEIIKKTVGVAVWPVTLAKDIYNCMGNAFKGMKDYVNGNFDKKEKELTKVTSWDPNAKEGPAGYGTNGFMATSAPMNYTIYFENKKEATAPAYEIIVVDTLDENVFDINTVEFGAMSHSLGIATQTGNILKWQFTGIELVPNVNPPEGEGYVQFWVRPKNNLPTGTAIKNHAVIKFDLNPWLATNDFINTLDFDPPVTTPQELYRVAGENEVELTWSKEDGAGAGVKNSTVYVSNNDGPFTVAATVDSQSVRVPVEPNIVYKFYVLSQDNVGNMEIAPTKTLEILTDVSEKEIIPDKFELSQNYPNPFNPATRISFALPQEGFVQLKIFDVLGQEIITLIDGERKAGNYTIDWNAGDFSTGVYIYQLTWNNQKLVKKMLLVK